MKLIPLSIQERITTGASHKAIITYEDLVDTAGTGKTLSIFTDGKARDIVDLAYFDLVTAFDGGATTNLVIDFGWNGASSDDPDGLIDNVELHADGTEILASTGTGTKYAAQEAFSLEAVFTATAANLDKLTQGEVHVYFNHVRLPDLR
jgi:hypothetical protein